MSISLSLIFKYIFSWMPSTYGFFTTTTRRWKIFRSIGYPDTTQEQDSPIFKLDDKLLCDIFLAGVKSTWCSQEGVVGQSAFALLVSQVCHRWREVAQSDKELWSYIHITFPFHTRLIQHWHEHARSDPIEFRLTGYFHTFDLDHPLLDLRTRELTELWKNLEIKVDIALQDWTPFCKILCENLSRYRSIVVLLPLCSTKLGPKFSEIFMSYPEPLPLLERFFFKSELLNVSSDAGSNLEFFQGETSVLRAVRIGCRFSLRSDAFLNLETLEITLHNFSLAETYSMLLRCTGSSTLKTIIFTGDFLILDNAIEHLPYLNLPNLSTLRFNGSNIPVYLRFAQLFRFTPCRHIFYWGDWNQGSSMTNIEEENGPVDSYRSPNEKEFTRLEALTAHLHYNEADKQAAEIAALRTLFFCFPNISTARLDIITTGGFSLLEGFHLWPKMHTLRICPCELVTPEFLMGTVLKVVRSRSRKNDQPGNWLRKLELGEETLLDVGKQGVDLKPLTSLVAVSNAEDCWYWLGEESNDINPEEY